MRTPQDEFNQLLEQRALIELKIKNLFCKKYQVDDVITFKEWPKGTTVKIWSIDATTFQGVVNTRDQMAEFNCNLDYEIIERGEKTNG